MNTNLEVAVERHRRSTRSESYAMSIGELMNLYVADEMDLHPDYQRLFRWTHQQKVDFIESVLLRIPLPAIFVYQRPDGVWDVVDGLQRLSTIFEFVGILRDVNAAPVEALILAATELLPELQGVAYEAMDHRTLTTAQRIDFKRQKMDVKIILSDSDETAKTDLFVRLNTGGTPLSQQEVRNVVMYMASSEFLTWFKDVSGLHVFRQAIAMSAHELDEAYHEEMALRFISLYSLHDHELRGIKDVPSFLTRQARILPRDDTFDRQAASETFRAVFTFIDRAFGNDAFTAYDTVSDPPNFGFDEASFDVLALGLAPFIDSYASVDDSLVKAKMERLMTDLHPSTTTADRIILGRTAFRRA
ncbi:MAG: hypothetical protein JWP08_240 [Bryobacterales bacterium]|nr:hypothetical protein [Bryobacterales bacterium]